MLFKSLIFLMVTFFSLRAANQEIDQESVLTLSVIIPVLKDSATINRGSFDWKEAIKASGSRLKTQTVALDDKKYHGLQARLVRSLHKSDATIFLFKETAFGAVFFLEHKDGMIHIQSSLKQTKALIALPSRHIGSKRFSSTEEPSDQYTKCVSQQSIFQVLNTPTEFSFELKCNTTLPLAKFMTLIGG